MIVRMGGSFVPDPNVAEIAEAYAQDAVDLAAKGYQTQLDWTDASVAKVEAILAQLHASMPTPKPPEDVIWNFAKGFGSYIGEVFRRNHAGEWGMISDGTNSFPGIRSKVAPPTLFWPWGRVHKRIVEGDEHNVRHYYEVLVEQAPR
jgi:hypothetical protein